MQYTGSFLPTAHTYVDPHPQDPTDVTRDLKTGFVRDEKPETGAYHDGKGVVGWSGALLFEFRTYRSGKVEGTLRWNFGVHSGRCYQIPGANGRPMISQHLGRCSPGWETVMLGAGCGGAGLL